MRLVAFGSVALVIAVTVFHLSVRSPAFISLFALLLFLYYGGWVLFDARRNRRH